MHFHIRRDVGVICGWERRAEQVQIGKDGKPMLFVSAVKLGPQDINTQLGRVCPLVTDNDALESRIVSDIP